MIRVLRILALAALALLGISAQAQEVLRPTADTDGGFNTNYGCTGVNVASQPMPLAYDAAGIPTGSILTGVASSTGAQQYTSRVFSGIPRSQNAYTALTLNVNSTGGPINFGGGASIVYSTNGGVSWTSLRSGSTWNQAGDTINLGTTQDLSAVIVAACASGFGINPVDGSRGRGQVEIWDIWTVGTTTPNTGGNGSGAGQANRNIVVVN